MGNQAFIVPIELKAWVVNNGVRLNKPTQRWTNTYFNMSKSFTSPEPDPDSNIKDPKTGVYIHWDLPTGLRHGLRQTPIDPLSFPAAPNRWLLVRLSGPIGKRQAKAWILESDYASRLGESTDGSPFPKDDPYFSQTLLGRSVDLSQWPDEKSKSPDHFLKQPLTAVANGYQVAIMAPTEILAEQHKINFSNWMQPLSINVGWLTGRLGAKEKREQLAAITNGNAQIIVGTHALFQDSVNFLKLGLIIIDEQHRFGVQQRLSLRNKANHDHTRPHQLIMTATPIPRTLAMSAYADLDISVIDELPPGRTPVTTVTISDARRDEVIQRVHHACTEGKQVYWVCTLIEESEQLEAQAAEVTATQLASVLQSVRIGLIHGRLKPAEKDAVMNAFKTGAIQLLVATTVIEVGVDVPNASLMIIENPERLGLAQLHQLRGRVGRGSIASHCVLLYASPLSQHSKARLQVMRESNDGFYIAEQDLLLRGPGEVLGTKQTGDMQLKIADLQRDAQLLENVRKIANQLLHQYPENCQPLMNRWLGENDRYWHA